MEATLARSSSVNATWVFRLYSEEGSKTLWNRINNTAMWRGIAKSSRGLTRVPSPLGHFDRKPELRIGRHILNTGHIVGRPMGIVLLTLLCGFDSRVMVWFLIPKQAPPGGTQKNLLAAMLIIDCPRNCQNVKGSGGCAKNGQHAPWASI